jgi:membrane dipeptidase
MSTTRRTVLKSALGAGVASTLGPMINFGSYQVHAATPQKYSARVVKLVERSLVIDMLAPLKLDFTPEAFALPASEKEIETFRGCGITGFHNSVGVGGPTAYDDALEFLAAWQGYAGRNSQLYSLVGRATDLDQAKAQRKIAVIMGLQNADQFRDPTEVKKFYQLGLRCAQLTYNSQNFIGSGST